MSTPPLKDEAFDRVLGSLQPKLLSFNERYLTILQKHCDSPIELMFGVALCATWAMSFMRSKLAISPKAENNTPYLDVLTPQLETQGYRVDFALSTSLLDHLLFIECDGHDFHEKTKEQAARDKRRDRELQSSGAHILRFTGSEIYRDAGECATETIDFINDRAFKNPLLRSSKIAWEQEHKRALERHRRRRSAARAS